MRARRLAAEIVGRVLRSGAYANVALESLTSADDPKDRSRAKALVYGVIRRLEPIDEAIMAAASRPIGQIQPGVIDRLRVSTFELMCSDVPSPVAVSAGVDLVRELNERAAGFANAVLRRVADMQHPRQMMRLPVWLTESLSGEWGKEDTEAFCRESAKEAARVARFRPGSAPVGEPIEGIADAFQLPPGPLPPGAVIQDAASIAVGNVVAAEPGMKVVDLAAAPGGKTLHLLDQVGPGGMVIASDRHFRRARDGRKRVPGAKWLVADGREPALSRGRFDRVLVDAPCTGLGTLRRRPEIRLRVTPEEVSRLAALQREILEAALELVAPGGRLVYSVCTVTPEETVAVTEGFGFRPVRVPGRPWGGGTLMAPHITGTDGMYVAVYEA